MEDVFSVRYEMNFYTQISINVNYERINNFLLNDYWNISTVYPVHRNNRFRAIIQSCQRAVAMAQAVGRRPLAAKNRYRSLASPCGICDGQSGTGTEL